MPFLFNQKRPIVVCPIDDHLIYGPVNGLESVTSRLSAIVRGKPDALLTFPGVIERYWHLFDSTPVFVNLSASTNLSFHTRKARIFTVEHATALGASGVAVHINLRSKYAHEMIENASSVIVDAKRLGLPVLGIVYPRGEHPDGSDDNAEDLRQKDPNSYDGMVLHCVSFALNMGFHAVKTFFPTQSLPSQRLREVAGTMPVLLAGGPKRVRDEVLGLASNAIHCGAAGICFGRNIFGETNSSELIEDLRHQMENTLCN